ncbi:Sec-independent protein translocase TatD [Sinobacterium caligoides]|uniref:Sec-independent protein translocase TatD n=1 Tax=Sinobacterium caligoides TaxID=933926 RepID=A0A3N2DKL6_9GAMM|nr:TatD family hydrolase [Sinobacterium caligoides]ROS00318.1 Sec-independent protein translocase TatD [Sinobacterium caligoides]
MYIDIGLNLCNQQFDKDREKVIERALEHQVTKMLLTGTSLSSSLDVLQLCEQQPDHFWATAGIHPHDASSLTADSWPELFELMQQDKVVAIGETGLDFNRNFSTPSEQQSSFEQHIEAAITLQKPLFLHERDAGARMLEMLRCHRDQLANAVVHCFTADKETLYGYLDLDLYIGITGWICDERRGLELQKLVREIPENRLLLETDAPYLLPRDLKAAQRPAGFTAKTRRNEPCLLPHVAAAVAEHTGRSLEAIATQTSLNAERIFTLR